MPIYEYQCTHCDHRLEVIQKIADDPLVDCPACNHANLQKLISAASFRLKGGGWYETDFKTGNKKQLADSGSETAKGNAGESQKGVAANGKSEKKAGAKGDNKPPSKPTSSSSASSKSNSGSADKSN